MKKNSKKKKSLLDDFYSSGWNKKRTKWRQPPVPIKHGDVVDIEYEPLGTTLLGRYIGKGMVLLLYLLTVDHFIQVMCC